MKMKIKKVKQIKILMIKNKINLSRMIKKVKIIIIMHNNKITKTIIQKKNKKMIKIL